MEIFENPRGGVRGVIPKSKIINNEKSRKALFFVQNKITIYVELGYIIVGGGYY